MLRHSGQKPRRCCCIAFLLADPLVLEKERYALLYLTKRRVALKDLSFTLIILLFFKAHLSASGDK